MKPYRAIQQHGTERAAGMHHDEAQARYRGVNSPNKDSSSLDDCNALITINLASVAKLALAHQDSAEESPTGTVASCIVPAAPGSVLKTCCCFRSL